MPRKRTYRTRSYRKRRNYKQARMGAKKLAQKAIRMTKSLQKKVEVKYKTIFQQNTPAASTWHTTLMVTPEIAQGNTPNTREGRKIRVKSTSLVMQFLKDVAPLSAANWQTPPQEIRIIVWRDRRPQSTAADITDFMVTGEVESQYKVLETQERGRFQILMDKKYQVPSTITSKTIKWFSNRPYDLTYTEAGTTGVYAQIQQNVTFVSCIQTQQSGTNYNNNFKISGNFKYTDA